MIGFVWITGASRSLARFSQQLFIIFCFFAEVVVSHTILCTLPIQTSSNGAKVFRMLQKFLFENFLFTGCPHIQVLPILLLATKVHTQTQKNWRGKHRTKQIKQNETKWKETERRETESKAKQNSAHEKSSLDSEQIGNVSTNLEVVFHIGDGAIFIVKYVSLLFSVQHQRWNNCIRAHFLVFVCLKTKEKKIIV